MRASHIAVITAVMAIPSFSAAQQDGGTRPGPDRTGLCASQSHRP